MSAAPLIATKFHLPTFSADLVSRYQLFQRLDQGLNQPLTLISAPPGFGKTMLVSGWLHSRPKSDSLKIGWLSLDENDNETGVFWRYFIAAIQRACPQIGGTAQAMLAASSPPSNHTILGTLINELAELDASVLIVLDDYHLIQSQDIDENLTFFLDHLPSNVHLVLLTREDPPLGLARRRARQQMVEIRATDLRFDLHETKGFLNNTRKLSLTPEQIVTLDQRAEGWIAGLQMAALALQGRDANSFFESFSGDNRYIADYLIEEVLRHQSDEVRTFLLKTSILERMSASACAALIGNASSARKILDYLERANLFIVPLDNHREWYRYHHLFADLLRKWLKEKYSPEEIANLYTAASEWHESQNDIHAAVRYAHHIPDHARIVRLLEQNVVAFFARAELPQFFESARLLPVDMRKRSPFLCISVAWAGLTANRRLETAEWLTAVEHHFGISAESILDDPSLDPARRAALLEVLVVRLQLPSQRSASEQRAHIIAIRDQLNTLSPQQRCLLNPVSNLKPVISFNLGLIAHQLGETSLAARAYAECVSLSRETQNSTLFHLALGNTADIQFMQGQLRASRQTHEQALAEARSLGVDVSPVVSVSHAGLGSLYYEWNDLASAERYFNEGLPQARMWNHWESLLPIAFGRSRIKQRAGDIQSALSILDELDSPPFEHMTFSLEARSAYLRLRASDRASASAWLAAKVTAATLEPSPLNELALLDVARLMTALQRLNDSIALLQNIIRFSESGARTYRLIQAKILLAKAMALKGDTSQSIACLMEVLPLAMPEGYISTFVDEGETVRQLLSDSKSKVSSELRNYVERILMGFGVSENQVIKREAGDGRRPERVEGSDLSEREREILSLIAEGLSNQGISERLVISITTVKTHVGNIFNKLGVNSRTQAIARAEGLGLLPRR